MLHGLKQTYKGKGKYSDTAEALNRINRRLNNLIGFDGIYIESVGDETRFFFRGESGESGGGGSAVVRSFSIKSIDQEESTVSVNGGFIIHGQKKIVIASATVAIAGGSEDKPTQAGIEYTYGGSAKWIETSVEEILPTPTMWMQPMFSAYKEKGRVKIKEVLWDSIIVLPSVFSA